MGRAGSRRRAGPAAIVVLLAAALSARAAESRVFLWEIKAPAARAYLLGSIHAAKPKMYPLDERIEKAFAASDALVVEVDMLGEAGRLAGLQMMAKAAYPADDAMDRHVPRDLFRRAERRVAKLGLPLDVRRFRPWFLGMTLTLAELARMGITAEHGVDLHFLRRARPDKTVLELETAESQVLLLTGMTEKEQALFLEYSLDDADNVAAHMDEIVEAWKTGDAERLDRYLKKAGQDAPELKPLMKRLIDDRNRTMAAKIEEYLASGKTLFIVVGAAHLTGETGLVRLLGRKYAVTQQ